MCTDLQGNVSAVGGPALAVVILMFLSFCVQVGGLTALAFPPLISHSAQSPSNLRRLSRRGDALLASPVVWFQVAILLYSTGVCAGGGRPTSCSSRPACRWALAVLIVALISFFYIQAEVVYRWGHSCFRFILRTDLGIRLAVVIWLLCSLHSSHEWKYERWPIFKSISVFMQTE